MRRSIKKVAAGLLATMMIGTMLTGCGGGNKKDSGSSKKETSEINIGFSQVGAESDWRVANTKSMKSALTAKNGFKLSFADAQQKLGNLTDIHLYLHELAEPTDPRQHFHKPSLHFQSNEDNP